MKYLLTLDFKELLRHKWLIFGFYGIVILFLIFSNAIDDDIISTIFVSIGGYQKISHPIVLIYTLLIFGFYTYMVLVIFTKDFTSSSNIFLRISKIKWFNFKILDILLIIFMFEVIMFMLLILVFWIFGVSIDILFMFNVFITDVMAKMVFIFVTLILYIMFNYYGCFINLSVVLFSTISDLVKSCYFSINYFDSKLYLVIYLVVFYFISRYVFVKFNSVLFERSM